MIRTVGHHGYVGDGFRFASNGIVSAGFPPAGAKTGVCLVGDDADEVVVGRAHGASAFPSFRLLFVPPSNGHEIGADIVDEVARKVARLPLRPGMSVRTALVYEGSLAPSVEAEGWFDHLIPANRLFEV